MTTTTTTSWYSMEARLDLSGTPKNDNTFTMTLEEGRRCIILGVATIVSAIYGESGSTTVNSNSIDVSNVLQGLISGGNINTIINPTTMGGSNPFIGDKTLYLTYTLTASSPPTVHIIRYYFSVDTATNTITGFFNYDDIGVNCYVSRVPAPFNDDSIDVFTTTNTGQFYVNFTDVRLQQLLGNNTPYFNFYGYDITGNGMEYHVWMWTLEGIQPTSSELRTLYVHFTSLVEPPVRVPTMYIHTQLQPQSLYTDNAMVYYKPHTLSTGGGGNGVRNSRYKQRRT